VRRIFRKGEVWQIEERCGSASGEVDTFQAAYLLDEVLNEKSMREEVLVLLVNKRAH